MFGMLESLTKSVVSVVALPVAVAADVLTVGKILTDQKDSYTSETLKKVKDNFDDAFDPKGKEK